MKKLSRIKVIGILGFFILPFSGTSQSSLECGDILLAHIKSRRDSIQDTRGKDPIKAEELARKLIDTLSDINLHSNYKCRKIKAEIYEELAVSKLYLLKFNEAENSVRKGLELVGDRDSTFVKAEAFNTLAEIFKERYKTEINQNSSLLDSARLIYELALENIPDTNLINELVLENISDTNLVQKAYYYNAVIFGNLAEVHIEKKEYDTAKYYIKKSLYVSRIAPKPKLEDTLKYNRHFGYIFESLADLYERSEIMDSAKVFLDSSIFYREPLKDEDKYEWMLINIRYANHLIKERDESFSDKYEEASLIGKSIGPGWKRKILRSIDYEDLANYYEFLKDERDKAHANLATARILLVFLVFSVVLLLIEYGKVRREKTKTEKQKELAESRKKYIEQLRKISEKITSTLNLNFILKEVYKEVNKVMDASIFGIGFYSPTENLIEIKLAINEGRVYKPYIRNLNNKKQYPAWCIDNALMDNMGIVYVNNTETEFSNYGFDSPPDDGNRELIDGSLSRRASSLMYVPLVFEKKVLGLITVQSFESNAYNVKDKNFLEDLARIVSISLANAKTFEEVYQSNLKKDLIISVTDHDTHKFFGWAKSSVEEIDKKNQIPELGRHISNLRKYLKGIELTFKNLKKWSSQLKLERFEPKLGKVNLTEFVNGLGLYEAYAGTKQLKLEIFPPSEEVFIRS